MTQSKNQARNAESGFTLVELAIVMIIIGLLIGGILKGQELINNARVSSTVAQTKAVESGISGFRDKYSAVPGDMANSTNRIPNCTATTCARSGNGDGLISTNTANTGFDPGVAQAADTEMNSSFVQLAVAGFIGGVGGGTNAAAGAIGITNPSIPLGGAWKLGYNNDSSLTGATTISVQSGTYIVSAANPTVASDQTSTFTLTPVQAESIDKKLDDGLPTSGSVVAITATPAGAGATGTVCATGAVAAGPGVTAADSNYNTALTTVLCGVAVKVM